MEAVYIDPLPKYQPKTSFSCIWIPKTQFTKAAKPDDSHAYPSLAGVVEDETAHTRNIEQLQLETDKPKPRLDVVHTLMTETFTRRHKWILEQKTVNAVIKEYPFLRKPIHVRKSFHAVSDARHHTPLVTDVWANSIFVGESWDGISNAAW